MSGLNTRTTRKGGTFGATCSASFRTKAKQPPRFPEEARQRPPVGGSLRVGDVLREFYLVGRRVKTSTRGGPIKVGAEVPKLGDVPMRVEFVTSVPVKAAKETPSAIDLGAFEIACAVADAWAREADEGMTPELYEALDALEAATRG